MIRAEIYFLISFDFHNVTKETCRRRAGLLSEFDGVPHTYSDTAGLGIL